MFVDARPVVMSGSPRAAATPGKPQALTPAYDGMHAETAQAFRACDGHRL